MKKLFTILALMLFAFSVNAQESAVAPGETSAQKRAFKAVHKMKEQIQLTSVQEKEVLDIMTNHFTQIEALKTDTRPAGEVDQARDSQRRATELALSQVLTQGQMLQYRQMRKEAKAQGHNDEH